jgi:hypothetical protein
MPIVPFALETCTLVESTSPEEQAALVRFLDSCETLPEFWERCTYSPWMLRMLQRQAAYLTTSPEYGLRKFALECVDGLNGTDVPAFSAIIAAVKGRLDGTATAADLVRVRTETQATVTPGGIQGLPRFSPYAAGALAVWHAANPDPVEAAYWTAEFRTLHDAFKIVCDRAASWKPEDRADWRGGWREAAFARTHPDVYRQALHDSRERLANLLRSRVPSPFGPPVSAEVFVRAREDEEEDDGEFLSLLCGDCASAVTGANRLVLFDARAYGCSSCGRPFVCRTH